MTDLWDETFRADAWTDPDETLAWPTEDEPWRPLVVARGDRVRKIYDLTAFDPVGVGQLHLEAATAKLIQDVPGVVRTYRTFTTGRSFVIEMERLGHPLTAYLDPARSSMVPPERWGMLFEQVASALQELHRRNVVHHDIKPGNLLFDRRGERLVVADFSVSTKRKRLQRGDFQAAMAGTPRYIAPEQFDGRSGPKVDQYSLAVTVGDVLGDGLPRNAIRALMRARSHEPEERYPRISDFGTALRSALDSTAPYRLSSWLQTVSPALRYGWGPTAVMMLASYVAILLLRSPRLNVLVGLTVPLMVGAVTQLMFWMVASLRARRTQPRLKVADHPWFSATVTAALIAALWPLISDDPKDNSEYVAYAVIVGVTLSGVLGSMPRHTGTWLIGLAGRWDRWRKPHRGHLLAWWSVRGVLLVLLAVVAVLPSITADLWPRRIPLAEQIAPGAIRVVAQLREAMLTQDAETSCRLVTAPPSKGIAPCTSWMPVAATWLRDEVRSGATRFDLTQLRNVDVHYVRRSTLHEGKPAWNLRTLGDHREYLGYVEHPVGSDQVWTVLVTRQTARDDAVVVGQSEWRYEVVERQGHWRVTAVQVCNYSAETACVTTSQQSVTEIDADRQHGPP